MPPSPPPIRYSPAFVASPLFASDDVVSVPTGSRAAPFWVYALLPCAFGCAVCQLTDERVSRPPCVQERPATVREKTASANLLRIVVNDDALFVARAVLRMMRLAADPASIFRPVA